MTSHADTRTERYVQVESTLAIFLVLFKAYVLCETWGRTQGYDPFFWLETFRGTHWFEPLPSPRLWVASYHPPLSYLLGRLVYAVYPHEVEVSQVLSTLAVLVAFFSLRHVLRRVGWLWSLPGLWVLYGGMSIPVILSIGVETTYDSLVIAFFMWAMAASVSLFWDSQPMRGWWKNNTTTRGVVWLGLIFALGLLNKYTGVLSFCLPFLVIFLRRGFFATLKECVKPIAAIVIAIAVICPFYYQHYYKTEHSWMPAAMEWQREKDLVKARAQRDVDAVAFVKNMVRYPEKIPENPQAPVLDSFVHSSWLHLWFKDSVFGPEPEPALTISRKYSSWFAYALFAGSVYFLVRIRRIDRDWRQFGLLLLSLVGLFSFFALYFGWKYPLWDWRVFKTKYMTPAVFWLPYVLSIPFSDQWVIARRNKRWMRWIEDFGFAALLLFMTVNHVLPIYEIKR